ncbi:MAG: hypothetical protein HY246_14200, partial [Proteobacteria bacterium]|nr:hypothetical protein [Pseudomonadota bacterium]
SVLADFRLDYVKTVYAPLVDVAEADVQDWYAHVANQGLEALREVTERTVGCEVQRVVDVRYQGQGYEVTIPFSRLSDIPDRFSVEYQKLYGARHDDAPIDVISFRATVIGRKPKPTLSWRPRATGPARMGTRQVRLKDKAQEIAVYHRGAMPVGWQASGPFLVDQDDTTCLVTAGWSARVDEQGTLRLDKVN